MISPASGRTGGLGTSSAVETAAGDADVDPDADDVALGANHASANSRTERSEAKSSLRTVKRLKMSSFTRVWSGQSVPIT